MVHIRAPKYKEENGLLRLLEAAMERVGVSPLFVTDKRGRFITAHREIRVRNSKSNATKRLPEMHFCKQRYSNNVMEEANGMVCDYLRTIHSIREVTSEMVRQ